MDLLQHFSHRHPLVFNQDQSQGSDQKAYCSGCGELVRGPSFSCVACGFYLDEKCAKASLELNHPFHPNHSFELLEKHPYKKGTVCPCDLCKKSCENFVYHCSCQLDLHIKCAFLSLNIAEKRIGELQSIARIDPSISTENNFEELKKAKCFACWKPLIDSSYLSPNCGFYLHAKCVDLPVETNHPLHPKHLLLLQFNTERLPCKICQKTQWRGFVYSCSPCKFVLHIDCTSLPTEINNPSYHKHPLALQLIDENLPCQICQQTKHEGSVYCCSTCKFAVHIECASSPPTIENKSHHQHPFVLFRRRTSFICDACGTPGNHVSYICLTCSIIVHKKCISLPRTLKHPIHPQHPILHAYSLEQDEFDSWECRFCHSDEEVNPKYGCYYCSHCKYIAHVNCAIEDYKWYKFDDESESNSIDDEENSALLRPYSIIKETKEGENVVATEIQHFTHQHKLVLSNDVKEDKLCDGCVLPIFSSHYYCSQCDFFLHKSCAELRRKKRSWIHNHPTPHALSSDNIFQCRACKRETSGFAYTCDICKDRYCLPCASLSDMLKWEGHEHPLFLFLNYRVLCNACGKFTTHPYRCKRCNFNVDRACINLPIRARHNSDEHLFVLTYGDNNSYSESCYCDICEEKRDPNHWFYFCAICNNAAHVDCVLGKYSFIKLGSIYKKGDHPHHLTFVKKVYYYPECNKCGKPCLDLALECKQVGCNYIVHWECIKPPSL